MHEDLKQIMELQELDLKIHEHVKSKAEMPTLRDDLKKSVDKVKTDVTSMTAKLEAMEAEKRKAERDLVAETDALAKSKERLNTITTNREYDAVHEEITGHEKKMKALEEKTIALMESLETASKEKTGTEAALAEMETKNNPEIQRVDGEITAIDGKIVEVQEQRTRIAQSLPPRVLRQYERILKGRKNGRVVAHVSNSERNCSFCFKTLTLQQINEVRRNEGIITCDNCGSILIWTEQEHGKN